MKPLGLGPPPIQSNEILHGPILTRDGRALDDLAVRPHDGNERRVPDERLARIDDAVGDGEARMEVEHQRRRPGMRRDGHGDAVVWLGRDEDVAELALALHTGPELGRAMHVGGRLLRRGLRRGAAFVPFVCDFAPRCAHTPAGTASASMITIEPATSRITSSISNAIPSVLVAAYPRRIVCLTEETTETLYLLGEGDRVVGVSGYTVRPPEARQKPKVSAFINARFDKIEALEPDLILAFSDLQADIAAELIRRGYTVVTFNQRSIAEILQMIRMIGALVGLAIAPKRSPTTRARARRDSRAAPRASARARACSSRSGTTRSSPASRWVDELVEIAGGAPIFPAPSHRRTREGPHRHRRRRARRGPGSDSSRRGAGRR